jgi:ferredoxin-like protein FixX
MSTQEDEYFAREEALKLHKLHADKVQALETADLEERKKLHYMHCPKCGYDLETITWRTVNVEKCFHCGAIVLDDGELETLAGEEEDHGFLRSFFELFKP